MKKVVILFAFLFAVSMNVQANTSVIVNSDDPTVVAQNEDFEAVKLEDLSEDVQTAIKTEVEKNELKIKEVLQHKETKDLKVVAVKNETEEVVFLFDKDGKLKEDK